MCMMAVERCQTRKAKRLIPLREMQCKNITGYRHLPPFGRQHFQCNFTLMAQYDACSPVWLYGLISFAARIIYSR
jgi:hypothetical protein